MRHDKFEIIADELNLHHSNLDRICVMVALETKLCMILDVVKRLIGLHQ